VATPVNWKQGEKVVLTAAVSNDEAKELCGTWESPVPYIRLVPPAQLRGLRPGPRA
jgi:hypothetical protein